MQTMAQVRAAGLVCFPCNLDKSPRVKSWKDSSTYLGHADTRIGGLAVPEGVIIIDLDLYNGITREAANQALGCQIDWDNTLIQRTKSGGEHHAFRLDFKTSQRSGDPIKGFDTRVGGKGYICFGEGYTPVGEGVRRLSDVAALPELPAEARAVLEDKKVESVKRFTGPDIEIDDGVLISALRSIDPHCDRTTWLNVGMALQSKFGDVVAAFTLFDNWSRGDLWRVAGIPKNYREDKQYQQWESFSSTGNTKIGTIYHLAKNAGWKREGKLLTHEEISKLLGPSESFPSNPSDAGIIHADRIPASQIRDCEPGKTGKQPKLTHDQAARLILMGHYRGRISRINNNIRWWSGREWEPMSEINLQRFIVESLPERYGQHSYCNGVYKALLIRLPSSVEGSYDKNVYFKNGFLNVLTNEFKPHMRENLNLGTLTVDYNEKSNINIPEWEKFLISIFGSLSDDRVLLLQEVFGWLMIIHNLGIEKYIALTGVTRAGKGVVLRILMMMLGKIFCGPINFSELGTPQGHSALWRFNVTYDSEAKMPKREDQVHTLDTLQKMTSNEVLSSRRLYKNDNLEGVVNCKLIVACNQFPVFKDDSGASASRVIPIVFDRSFLGKEDPHLAERLNKEIVGITHWSLVGLRRLMANKGKFVEPESTMKAVMDLEIATRVLSDFIEQHLVFDPEAKCFNGDIYKVFKVYCEETGFTKMSQIIFIKALKDTLLGRGVEWKTIRIGESNKRGAIGIRLKNPLGMNMPASPIPMKNT